MKLLPNGPWFGVTKAWLRRVSAVFGSAVVLLLLVYFGIRVLLIYQAHRTNVFAEQLAAIQVGQSRESLSKFLRDYEDARRGKDFGADEDHVFVHVDPWRLYGEFRPRWIEMSVKYLALEYPDVRRTLGFRIWLAQGAVSFKEGRVVSVSLAEVVEGQNEWLGAQWRLMPKIPEDRLKRYREVGSFRPEMDRYLVHWIHLHMGLETGEIVDNLVTKNAPREEREAATNINGKCLTGVRGCASLCELMPDATRYRRQHDYPRLGWNSGSWGPQDRSCE